MNIFFSILFHTISFMHFKGSNVKQLYGDKWYKVIEHNSDYDDHEVSDEDDINNNSQLLAVGNTCYRSDVESKSSIRSRFFECLRFRRNYKRNRKKINNTQGQLLITLFF